MHDKLQKHINWIQHQEIRSHLALPGLQHPWFPAYRRESAPDHRTTWFCALVPIPLVPTCLQDYSWDLYSTDGYPSVWTHYDHGKINKSVYCPFGNEKGIEPIVLCRDFHGIHENYLELSQEFRFYHNLYPDPSRKRFLHISPDGDDSEAVRYDADFLEIRTDLLLRFCNVKQMALGIFVDSFRHSPYTLRELSLKEQRYQVSGVNFAYHITLAPDSYSLNEGFKTVGGLMGKKYIMPGHVATDETGESPKVFQEFIIDTDENGNHVKNTCDPGKLADYFGKNPRSPHYLTPVFFRADVLSKYYADSQRYSVEDGYIRCGGLWGVRIDNDHHDYVVVWLGDLGTLSENERNYWLSCNIPPEGRKISETSFQRAFMAVPTDPKKPDLVFKDEYIRFQEQFRQFAEWDFFLPMHQDDKHFLIGLRSLVKDNQTEFDAQLLSLTKILVDSINEREISKVLKTLTENDKGITKLEKFFIEKSMADFQPHIKFLRVLQGLRSKSAAHRKGSNYDKLINDLQMADQGQQKVFNALLVAAINFVRYLRANLIKQSLPQYEDKS